MSRSGDDLNGDDWQDEVGGISGTAGRTGVPAAGEAAAVTQFLADLRSFADVEAPAPSPELAALLGGATPLPAARLRRHTGRIVRRVVLIAAAVVAGTTVAAANHSLPGPAQQVVSNVVNGITPFHIGPPAAKRTHAPTVTPTPSSPVPPPAPASDERERPSAPESSSEPGDDGGTSSAATVGDDRGNDYGDDSGATAGTGAGGADDGAGTGTGADDSTSTRTGGGVDDRPVTRSHTRAPGGGSDDGGGGDD